MSVSASEPALYQFVAGSLLLKQKSFMSLVPCNPMNTIQIMALPIQRSMQTSCYLWLMVLDVVGSNAAASWLLKLHSADSCLVYVMLCKCSRGT
jgi:hypothetical protein